MCKNALPHNRINRAAAAKLAGFALTELLAAGIVYCWRVFYYLDVRGVSALQLTGAVCGIAAALYGAALLTVRFVKSTAGRAAVCIFLCGLLFAFVNPPLQTPDEHLHFLRAYSISEGHFDFDADRAYPDDVARLCAAFPGAWVNAHTSAGMRATADGQQEAYNSAGYALKQYGEGGAVSGIWDGFADYFSGKEAAPVSEPLSFAILPYLPAAAGMAAARLLGGGALHCLYAGRAANLAVYTLLAFAALRRLKRFRPAFLAVLLLPMSLYIAGSLNYDSLLLGCYAFAATYFFDDTITPRGMAAFAAVFLMTNAVKPWINLLWVAALWFIPRAGWHCRLKRWQLAALCLAAAVAVACLVEWYGGAFRRNYPADIGRMLGATVNGGAQLRFILLHPQRYLAVVLGTLYENRFFVGMLGTFGAMDLPVELLNLLSPLALFAGAVLSAPPRAELRPRRAAAGAVWAVVYALGALTAIYITYTPVGMVRIVGFQARYLLPALLVLSGALGEGCGWLLSPQGNEAARVRASLWIFGLLGAAGALLLWQHYYIGPVYTI